MQKTYLFNELTVNAQENAIGLYAFDSDVQEYCDKHTENEDDPCLAENALDGLGWRFTEHGERIA